MSNATMHDVSLVDDIVLPVVAISMMKHEPSGTFKIRSSRPQAVVMSSGARLDFAMLASVTVGSLAHRLVGE